MFSTNEVDLSKAYNLNLSARRGDTFSSVFTVRDENNNAVDLSAYTSAKMQLKETEYSDAVATFTNSGTTYVINLDDLATGIIEVSATILNVTANTYLYDLELRNDTNTETIIYGKFKVVDDITK